MQTQASNAKKTNEPKVTQQPVEETFPSKAALLLILEQKRDNWIAKCKGRANYNPYVEVIKHIEPLRKVLLHEGCVVNEEIVKQVANVPSECPVIDPNWQPEQKQDGIFSPSPEQYGVKNLK